MIKDTARWIALGGIFLLPFLPLVVTNSLFFPFITGKNFLFRIVVEVIFAAWVVLACYDVKYRPRFSYILGGVLSLLGIMAFANAFGVSPEKSFWSNYERMEGYVALVHFGLYFLVAGSILTRDRLWNAFWNTSLFVATVMMLYGFCQLSGSESCPISQSDFRIDGRMGNAAYLAIYMLFHVFISLILFVRTRSQNLRAVYGILAVGFIFTLLQTGTRGTTLALFGGAFLSAAYIALFERGNRFVRKVAIGAIVAVVASGALLYAAKDTELIQGNDAIRRIASVSLTDGDTRFTIWSLAWEGVKERPLLGWGQENFNYVFNQNYKASLYGQEPWFDRVHNIVFDWMIAGGLLGFLAYASIIVAALYYVVIRPIFMPDADSLSVVERGLILGLIAAYVAHNMLVFDNLISYFLFFSILAMIHGQFSRDIAHIAGARIDASHVGNIVAPVMTVVALVAIYLINIPGLQAASDLIDGFQSPSPEARLEAFARALDSDTFAKQEVREQLVRVTQQMVQDQSLVPQLQEAFKLTQSEAEARAQKIRNDFFTRAEVELKTQLEETPDDVRILVFQSSFYRVVGKPEEAIEVLKRAVVLSPEKQQIHFELALALAQTGDMVSSHETFAHAFELEPRNTQARMLYAASAIEINNRDLFNELITPEYEEAFAMNDFVLRAAYERKQFDIVLDMLTKRVEIAPGDLQNRVSLAFAHYEAGQKDRSIEILEQAIKDFPDFKSQGEQYIAQVRQAPQPTVVR